jgi:hypothetical protein
MEDELELEANGENLSVPEIDESERQELVIRFEQARIDFANAERNLEQLRTNFPDEFAQLEDLLPGFNNNLDEVRQVVNSNLSTMSNDELINKIRTYNFFAQRFNALLGRLNNTPDQDPSHTVVELLDESNYRLIVETMTNEQKAELEEFVNQVMADVFPETYVAQFTRTASGALSGNYDETTGEYAPLEGYQNVLIAPANGIERVITGILNLANPETYRNLYNSASTVYNMTYSDFVNLWEVIKFSWENTSTVDKTAKLISIVSAVLFLGGLVGSISIPARLKPVLDGVITLSINANLMRSIPAASLAGLSLNYIPTNDIV